jgi:hypothetical protein
MREPAPTEVAVCCIESSDHSYFANLLLYSIPIVRGGDSTYVNAPGNRLSMLIHA